jgi:hypothetical protein
MIYDYDLWMRSDFDKMLLGLFFVTAQRANKELSESDARKKRKGSVSVVVSLTVTTDDSEKEFAAVLGRSFSLSL